MSTSEIASIRRNFVKSLIDRYVPKYFTVTEGVINDIAEDEEFRDYVLGDDEDCILRSFMNTLFFHLQDHEIIMYREKYKALGYDDFDEFSNEKVMKIEAFAAKIINDRFFSISDADVLDGDVDDFIQNLRELE